MIFSCAQKLVDGQPNLAHGAKQKVMKPKTKKPDIVHSSCCASCLRLVFYCMRVVSFSCFCLSRAGIFGEMKILHRESKKQRHQTLAHNFTKYWPIFKIFSLLDSVGNL